MVAALSAIEEAQAQQNPNATWNTSASSVRSSSHHGSPVAEGSPPKKETHRGGAKQPGKRQLHLPSIEQTRATWLDETDRIDPMLTTQDTLDAGLQLDSPVKAPVRPFTYLHSNHRVFGLSLDLS